MVYWIFWTIVNIALRVFYKRLYISGADKIPNRKPVILACNHPNSFLDAISLTVQLKRPLYFFARSDAMNTPLKRKLLGLFNIHPIYRIQEGKENLLKNEGTFNIGYNVLKNNGTVFIHSEGICVVEKRLRKLKKGTARMAFHAFDNNNFELDTHVVPVGFNYTYPRHFRQELILSLGEPFPVSNFKEIYIDNPAVAINKFNEKLNEELVKNVVIIKNQQNDQLCEELFIIQRNNNPQSLFPWKTKNNKRFLREKKLADTVNQISESNSVIYNSASKKVKQYFEQLKKLGITDLFLLKNKYHLLLSTLLSIILFPIYAFGKLLNSLPIFLGKIITKKTAGKGVFFDSVLFGSSMLIYIIYMIILSIIIAFMPIGPGWIYILIILFTGYISVIIDHLYNYLFTAIKANKMNKKKKEQLQTMRKEICNIFSI